MKIPYIDLSQQYVASLEASYRTPKVPGSASDTPFFLIPEVELLDLQEAVIKQGVFYSRTKSESLKSSSDSNLNPNSPLIGDDYLFLTFQ